MDDEEPGSGCETGLQSSRTGAFGGKETGTMRGKPEERPAKVVLGRGPIKWDPLPRPLLQRFLVSGNSRFQLGGIGLPLAEIRERGAEVVLGPGPSTEEPRPRQLFRRLLAPRHCRLQLG